MKFYDLVIPVFKEKKIVNLLDYLFKTSKNIDKIFICFDSFEDETLEYINKSKYKNNPSIILVKNPLNGPCEAVKSGIKKTKSDCIIVYPADDFENAKLLDEMYKYYRAGFDVVCPSRFMKGGIIKNCPLIKYLIVKTVSVCLQIFSNLSIKDPTNGFRFFSRKIINKFPIESKKGFAYSLELLVKAKQNNFKIVEIPSKWMERNDRKSNFKIFQWSRQYLKWFFLAIFN